MKTKQTFFKRIVWSFVLLTALVAGLFASGIVVVVHSIEEHLVSDTLRQELQRVLDQKIFLQPGSDNETLHLNPDTRFFAGDIEAFRMPASYRQLEPGFTEIVDGEEAYYAYSEQHAGVSYLLLQDQRDFEAREQMLFDVVLAGFIFSLLISWWLGLLLAKHVMAPVSRLAVAVRQRGDSAEVSASLEPLFADDEIGQLAHDFDTAFKRQQQSLERERLFTSDVSHELRTPLMVIQSANEVLQDADLPASVQPQLAQIERACGAMRTLTQTFLSLARDNVNASTADSASLGTVAREVVRDWQQSFTAKGLQFTVCDLGADDRRYHRSLLATVMVNLLRNALHYTERGAVQLSLHADYFSVSDSGPGVALDQQQRIFEAFVRGDAARAVDGTGLGLSLVKRICRQQGWRVEVSNLPQGGAVFTVYLHE